MDEYLDKPSDSLVEKAKKDEITLMLVKHFFGHMDIQKELHQLWDLIME